MTNLIIWIALYIIETLPVYVIANKCGNEYAWLAFVPIANLWLLCNMADLEIWLLILFFVPIANVLLLAVIWWRIAENTNKPGWIGLLMLIPFVNLFIGYYIAFVDTGRLIT